LYNRKQCGGDILPITNGKPEIAFENQVKSMPIKGSLTPQSLQSMGPPASDALQQHWEPLLILQAGKRCHQPLAEDHTQQDPLKHSYAVDALEMLE
jgi:hypothetical protein